MYACITIRPNRKERWTSEQSSIAGIAPEVGDSGGDGKRSCGLVVYGSGDGALGLRALALALRPPVAGLDDPKGPLVGTPDWMVVRPPTP